MLVDTGYGLRDVADPRGRLSRFFLMLLRARAARGDDRRPPDPAPRFEPTDVLDVVLTHLGFDHAGAGLPPEILLVPLIGHTFGHAGVAVRRDGGWLLQTGDAYFYRHEMNLQRPHCTPGLRFYQWRMEKSRRARLWNQARLRELRRYHGDEVTVCCAHDLVEFEALARRSAFAPAERQVPAELRPVP